MSICKEMYHFFKINMFVHIALHDRLFFFGPNVKDTIYAYRPENIQGSCQKLLHMDFHLTRRENRKATERAESFLSRTKFTD
jgi:hypothetical protein